MFLIPPSFPLLNSKTLVGWLLGVATDRSASVTLPAPTPSQKKEKSGKRGEKYFLKMKKQKNNKKSLLKRFFEKTNKQVGKEERKTIKKIRKNRKMKKKLKLFFKQKNQREKKRPPRRTNQDIRKNVWKVKQKNNSKTTHKSRWRDARIYRTKEVSL